MPSQLDDLYATVSFYDLKTKIKIKTEEKMADTMQAYESLCLVVSAALGGGKNSSPPPAGPAPQTAADLEAVLRRTLG